MHSVVVRCACLSVDHVVALDIFEDSAYLQVTRPDYLGLWDRIKSAWRYVVRNESRQTPYDVVCLSVEDAERMQIALLNYVDAACLRKDRGPNLEDKGRVCE